jgi:NitT/TauT family transport system permease protein
MTTQPIAASTAQPENQSRSTAQVLRRTAAMNPESGRDVVATSVVIVLLLAAMQIASGYVPDYVMPSPTAVAKAAYALLFTDAYHVGVTLLRLSLAVG